MSIKNSESRAVFDRLRELLAAHASEFALAYDTTDWYGLEAPVGPATLRSWGGKLRARMQGKACFNFRTLDETPLRELGGVTAESFAGLKRAGFIASGDERKRAE